MCVGSITIDLSQRKGKSVHHLLSDGGGGGLPSRHSSLAVNTDREGVSAPSAQPVEHPPHPVSLMEAE